MTAPRPSPAPDGPGSTRFRRARLEDVDAILELLAADQAGTHRWSPTDLDASARRSAFEAIDRDGHQLLAVAEADDGTIVGTLQLTFIPYLSHGGRERALVEGVRVASDRRGSGIGAAMMGWAVDRAHERGASVVQLTTDKSRTDAHRFYRSLGFAASHEGMKRFLDDERR